MKTQDKIAPRQPGGKPFLQTIYHIYPPRAPRRRFGRYFIYGLNVVAIGLSLAIVLGVAYGALHP